MTQPDTLHTKTLYRIPGLDGTWRITTLRTTNMAADGKATLDLVRVQDDDDPVVSAALISVDPSKIPQPEPTNLHDRLRFRIDVLLAIARAATPGPWEYATVRGVTSVGAPGVLPSVAADVHFDIDVHYLVAFSPDVTIPWLEGELEVLARHEPQHGSRVCDLCSNDWHLAKHPCAEIRSLAHRLGVSVDA